MQIDSAISLDEAPVFGPHAPGLLALPNDVKVRVESCHVGQGGVRRLTGAAPAVCHTNSRATKLKSHPSLFFAED